MRLVLITLMAVIACTAPFWRREELRPREHALLGCYELETGPWPDSAPRETMFRVRTDTLAREIVDGPAQRRLLVKGSSQPPFAYWSAVSSDSLHLRIGLGVEGQGTELMLAVRGDSVFGQAAEYSGRSGQIEVRAPAHGRRLACEAH